MTLPFDPTRRRDELDDLERLLEAALPAALSADVPGHVDVERLATWADQGLDPAEQLQVDAHLAACASCQELAAEFARTMSDDTAAGVVTETPTAAIRRWTPVRIAKWAAPLAAAAAVVVWMGRPDPSLPALDAIPRTGQGQQTAYLGQATAAPAPAAADETSRARQLPADSQPPDAELAQREMARRSLRSAAPSAATATVPVTTPPAAPPPPAMSPPVAVAGETTADRALKNAVGSVPRPVFEVVTRVVASQGQSAVRGDAGRGGAMASRMASGDPAVGPRWRVVDGRRIERSIDAGLTWSTLDIDPPAVLVAGGSPAVSTCWLVGERGLVLVSTDGERFVRASSPADITLSSVDATTARDATVTAVDGRRFATSDGGQTWRPLQ